MALELK